MGMGHRVNQVWYSKHKHRGKKKKGWFVMRNDHRKFIDVVLRERIADELPSRDAAIAIIKLLENANGRT